MTAVVTKSDKRYLKRLLDSDENSRHDDIFKIVKTSLARLRSWYRRRLLTEQQYQDIKRAYVKRVLAYGDIEARYTEGDCHLLAVALHNRLGWPVSVCHEEPGKAHTEADIAELAHHSFVTAPDGRVLDIYGYRSAKKVIKEFSCTHATRIDPQTREYDNWRWDAPQETPLKESQAKARYTAKLICLVYDLD